MLFLFVVVAFHLYENAFESLPHEVDFKESSVLADEGEVKVNFSSRDPKLFFLKNPNGSEVFVRCQFLRGKWQVKQFILPSERGEKVFDVRTGETKTLVQIPPEFQVDRIEICSGRDCSQEWIDRCRKGG